MKNEGFTLTELMIALVISSLIILSIAVLFVAEYRFRADTNNDVEVAREAKAVMSHMQRILRFAKPSSVSTWSSGVQKTLDFITIFQYNH